jgi:hypothetical protein
MFEAGDRSGVERIKRRTPAQAWSRQGC